MIFEAINSTFFTQKTHFKSSLKRRKNFKLDLKWVFWGKKLNLWLQTSLSAKFLIAAPQRPIGRG
jgi:hypothetical protein